MAKNKYLTLGRNIWLEIAKGARYGLSLLPTQSSIRTVIFKNHLKMFKLNLLG